MKIAIVDDAASEREGLRDKVKIQLQRCAFDAEIEEFADGETFLESAKQNHFTLAFLDIYMESENGIETAKELRSFDKDCILVFITSSVDHALEGFRVRALQYLVKPYSDEDLAAVFDELMLRLSATEPYAALNTGNGIVRLLYKEILYAEHFEHRIYVHTTDGRTVVTRQTFREFADQLADDRFFLCGRGTLINLEQASDLDKNVFILKNGQRILITREMIKTARTAFGDFLFKRGHG